MKAGFASIASTAVMTSKGFAALPKDIGPKASGETRVVFLGGDRLHNFSAQESAIRRIGENAGWHVLSVHDARFVTPEFIRDTDLLIIQRWMGSLPGWVQGPIFEEAPPQDGYMSDELADAIVEVTETGSTIKAHGLKIIYDLMETNTQLIANYDSYNEQWKKAKIEQILLLLKGALKAENMVGLKMNLPKKNLEQIIGVLPSLNTPTVAGLYDPEWISVETVVGKKIVRDLIPQLMNAGAQGIIEYNLNKVI